MGGSPAESGGSQQRRSAMAGWWDHPAYRPIINAVPAWSKAKLREEASQRRAALGSNLPSQARQWPRPPTSVPHARDVDELEAELEELLDDEFDDEEEFEEESAPSATGLSLARWFFGLVAAVGGMLALGSLVG